MNEKKSLLEFPCKFDIKVMGESNENFSESVVIEKLLSIYREQGVATECVQKSRIEHGKSAASDALELYKVVGAGCIGVIGFL